MYGCATENSNERWNTMSIALEQAQQMLTAAMAGLAEQLNNPQPADLMRIQIATAQVQATALLSIAKSLEELAGPYSGFSGIITAIDSLGQNLTSYRI